VRESVGNFYSNLAYPNVALNALLQGKVKQGVGDSLRFIVNTTVGLGGIFDPAASLGLKKNDEDFGQTLGVWGVDNTSYMYIPILGPSSNRDLIGLPVTIASNMLFYAGFFVGAPITVPLGLLAAVDKRAQHTEQMRIRDQAALDRYIFTREAYWQYRENLVFDGKPPTEAYDSLFIDEDLSDASDDRYFKEPCPEKSS
jgi:phospholipid-binding lipoprotein MlaA